MSKLRSGCRNALAASLRALPPFRGKGRLGVTLGRSLTDAADAECRSIVTIEMRDHSLMQIDVRSRTERWAFWTGEYEAAMVRRLSAILQPGWTVFDVGANVGFYTVALGRRLKELGGGTLHAFEPIPSNFERLTRCIALNALAGVVHPHNVALGDEEGLIDMHWEDSERASTGNAVLLKGKVIEEDGLTGNAQARITRLDTLVRQHQIGACHLVKLDVEGAEVLFLRGGAAFLSAQRPIIFGEFNRYWLKQLGHSFLDVAAIAQGWQYRLYRQRERGASFTLLDHSEAGIENVLLCPAETPDSVLTHLGVRR
jgi:FkbM family methyltransferase